MVAVVLRSPPRNGSLRAAEVIPAKPTRYFNDYALTVKPETADRLNGEVGGPSKGQTSNQILVVIYPKLQTDSDLADYCQRVYRAWQVGQKGTRTTARCLFVFVQNHKLPTFRPAAGWKARCPMPPAKTSLQDGRAPLQGGRLRRRPDGGRRGDDGGDQGRI